MCEVLSWSIGLSGYPFMVSRLGLQFVEEVVCEGHVSLHKFDGLEDRVVLVHAHPLSVVLVKVLRVVCRARPTFLFFGGGFWFVFGGFLDVWGCFLFAFWCCLVLYSYCLATGLLEGVGGCFL